MARIGKHRAAVAFIVLCAAHSSADDAAGKLRIPVLGQPTKHFYSAAGTEVTLRAEATPANIPLHQWLTYTLTISNLVNAADVEKPSLKMLVEFQEFQIEERANLDPPLDSVHKDRRVFVYRLRPNLETVELIPEIMMYYFDPRIVAPPNQPQASFRKAISNAIAIKVLPAEKPPAAEPVPLQVPAFAENLTWTNHGEPIDRELRLWLWFAVPMAPLAAIGVVLLWNWTHPNAARLRQIMSNRAARRLLAALDRKEADVNNAVLQYLRERWHLPEFAQTPAEVAVHLRSAGFSEDRVSQAVLLLQACDQWRFAPAEQRPAGLSEQARQLVTSLERPS